MKLEFDVEHGTPTHELFDRTLQSTINALASLTGSNPVGVMISAICMTADHLRQIDVEATEDFTEALAKYVNDQDMQAFNAATQEACTRLVSAMMRNGEAVQ